MPHTTFVHLHNHTQYSLLDGASKLSEVVSLAAEQRMPALAITDHGNMFGAVEFYETCVREGIKPIIGSEVYLAPGSRFEKTTSSTQGTAYHLTLLVRDERGYRNLMRLVSAAYLEGFYYRPRIDKELLASHAEGLIALSGCLKGEIPALLLRGEKEKAAALAQHFSDIFGRENFYLELMDNFLPEQKKLNPQLLTLAGRLSLGVVATNDVHYLRKKDARAQEALLCIQTQTMLEDPNRLRMKTEEFYFKSPREMQELFREVPEAISNTHKIAERCNLELDFSTMHLPHFSPPGGIEENEYLRKLCRESLPRRYPEPGEEVTSRLEHELKVIKETGYTSYFLIAHDAIQFARQHSIPVGPGRGSVAGSLVAYLVGITAIDPLRYGLLFERLLNPERVSPPDIDIDFCYERRGEVIEYVTEKYGKDRVAQIITFGTMAAKGVIRDVGRVMGMAYADVDRIAKLVPNELNIKLRDAIEAEVQLKTLAQTDPAIKELLDISLALEGLARHASTHAAGVVISRQPLTDHVPLFRSNEGQITTGYAMASLEKIGLLKIDFLGLRTLTVIDETLKLVNATRKEKIKVDTISPKDKKTFQLLNQAKTIGVFQLESPGMRDLAKKIGLNSFEDIIALVALFRPGPMHMLDDFVQRKHKKIPIRYDHELLKPILAPTYGVMLYQEQVIRVVNVLAGFSLAKSDLFRRAISKKIPEVMEREKQNFIEGAGKKGIHSWVAEKIFDHIEYFSRYGFNKSHSAAYAMIAYQTAYLKANFPQEFMSALLTSEKDNSDKVALYISEAKNMGIEILPPHVNESFAKFTVEGPAIRYGLLAVKNVGRSAIDSIIEARRQEGKFKSLYDFCERIDSRLVNRKVIESLIKCGAFDGLELYRSQLMSILEGAMEAAGTRQRDRQEGQKTFFDTLGKDAGFKTLFQKIPDIKEWPESQLLAAEKEILGFYISGHPLARYADILSRYATSPIAEVENLTDGAKVLLGGIIIRLKKTFTRKTNKRMAIVTLEDLSGEVDILVYPEAYEKAGIYLKDDSLIFVQGRINLREERPILLAQMVIPLEEAPHRFTREVKINLFTGGLEEDTLRHLKGILAHHPGKIPVHLNFRTPANRQVTLNCGNGLKVEPAERLREEIEALLGEGVVSFEKKEETTKPAEQLH